MIIHHKNNDMKKSLIIFWILICGLTANSQILTVPTPYITSTSAVRDTFINWEIRGWIIPTVSTDGTDNNTTFSITAGFAPQNTELNDINTAGGVTSNWPLYLRSIDSTVFAETIPASVGDNLYDIQGRYTSELLTWGNFLEVDHEMYWNAFNSNYHILSKMTIRLMFIEQILQHL